jgi:hypothetical protein
VGAGGAVVQELGGSMLDNGAQSRPAWEVFYPNPSMAALGCPSFFAGALGLVAFLSSAAQSRLQRQLCTCTTCTACACTYGLQPFPCGGPRSAEPPSDCPLLVMAALCAYLVASLSSCLPPPVIMPFF